MIKLLVIVFLAAIGCGISYAVHRLVKDLKDAPKRGVKFKTKK